MNKMPILCVDPDEMIRRGMTRLLSEDFEVKTSPGGEEELRFWIAGNERFEVVTVNRYPGMLIDRFVATMRAKYPRMPIIVFDTDTDPTNCDVDTIIFKGNWVELRDSITNFIIYGRPWLDH